MTSILIADDEQGIRDLFHFVLEAEGYEVVSVPDGQSAVREIEKRSFDLVILDVHMPKLTGPSALARIRELRPTQQVLVVSSSSDRTLSLEKQATDAGACAVLFKPLDLDEILDAVRPHASRSPRGARSSA